MKKMIYVLLTVLLIFLFACNEGDNLVTNDADVADESDVAVDKIVVGVLKEYKPYIVSQDGNVTGPYIEILSKLLENRGYDYEILPLPWSRLVSAVEAGTVDFAIPFFENVPRRAIMHYEEEPIGFSQISVIGLVDNNIDYDGTLESLKGYTIGVVQDYFYSQAFLEAVNNGLVVTDEALTSDQNIEKLLQGRVDVIVEDPEVVKDYTRKNNSVDKLIYYDNPITWDYSYLVFTKKKDLSQLRRDLHEEMEKMKRDSSFYAIYTKYDMEGYGSTLKMMEKDYPPNDKFLQDNTNTPITIGVIRDTKPYVYYEGDDLVGFNIDLMSEVMNRIGIEYEFLDLPFNRMIEELKSGSLDIGADFYLKPERLEYLDYPSIPFAAYPTVLFKKADLDFEYTGNLDGLKPFSIGVVRGYSIGPLDEFLESDDYNFVITDSTEQNMENLINDRVDLIIDIKSTGENHIKEMNKENEIISVEPAVYYDYSYMAFAKKNKLLKLVSEYELTIENMFEDGTIERLHKKYDLQFMDFEDFRE